MRKISQRLLLTLLFAPAALCASAQGLRVVKGDCTPGLTGYCTEARTALDASDMPRLSRPTTGWDASKTYKQLVILVSYSDTDFQGEHDKQFYDCLLNEPGYNQGSGRGSVADYFRDQSGGLFNLKFDVFGPYKVSQASHTENPTASTRNYGAAPMREATQMMMAENPTWDFKQYDWNGDGSIEQVVYIFAGYSGNQGAKSYGYVWPNTSSISSITTPDGIRISNYTNSAELWVNDTSCGIGTICHEFSHCLGLPDIYPTSGSTGFYSVCDEWDLMDGGNFTNLGWCPPNYTAQEKLYLGWLTPIELTEPTTVTDMKPVSEGGDIYLIRHTDKEYLLLENRQWTGWDAGTPGQGLIITHVDYDETAWMNNTVNATKNHFRCDIIHADNLHYEEWDSWLMAQNMPTYSDSPLLHNRHLSTSPYPWTTDATAVVNNALTDNSTPSATMFNTNIQGSKLLSKAITNIHMTEDGLISFDFMGGNPAGISTVIRQPSDDNAKVYNIIGQQVITPHKGLFIKNGKKYIKH